MARLADRYREEVAPALKERFGYKNVMQIPKIEKVVVNMGVGEAVANAKAMDGAMEDLAKITGQKPQLRRARKSVASFKVREGMPVGAKVTLRGERAWEFMDRLISVALPRVRDFRGVSPRGFDGRGNYALGLREQIIFPEIDYDAIDAVRGLDVAVVTTAETDDEAREMLRMLGMPFRDS
jgi:large subunit ribosomal protein L5